MNEAGKTYVLRIRAKDKGIFDAIRDGKKKIETRAATARYRSVKAGDRLRFVCGPVAVEKTIAKADIFKTVDALLEEYAPKDIHPSLKTKADIVALYGSFGGYKEKIRKSGIIAWRLEK